MSSARDILRPDTVHSPTGFSLSPSPPHSSTLSTMLARRAQSRGQHSNAPPLSPSSSSPSSPMSPTSPHYSPTPAGLSLAVPTLDLSTSPTQSEDSTNHHSPLPVPSIQKYSDELRRALSARFEAVAAAGRNARLPPPHARLEDPDYGYDEDPFDTRAKLLLSLDSPPPQQNAAPRRRPASQVEESFFDLGSDTEFENGPSRRWSASSIPPSPYGPGASTPSSEISYVSEASFEVGRASDWINLYGRARHRTPPATSRRNSVSSIGGAPQMLTPLHALRQHTPSHSPSPQPPTRRFRRRQHPHPYDLDNSNPSTPPEPYEPPIMARTTSETMILAAGLASQRERRRVRA